MIDICREWHFRTSMIDPLCRQIQTLHLLIGADIYFRQNNEKDRKAALKLRDAVLRLRRDGAFVAVPLYRVNMGPIGPHPVGEYIHSAQT